MRIICVYKYDFFHFCQSYFQNFLCYYNNCIITLIKGNLRNNINFRTQKLNSSSNFWTFNGVFVSLHLQSKRFFLLWHLVRRGSIPSRIKNNFQNPQVELELNFHVGKLKLLAVIQRIKFSILQMRDSPQERLVPIFRKFQHFFH